MSDQKSEQSVLVSLDLSQVSDADRKKFTEAMIEHKFKQAASASTWTSKLPGALDPMQGLTGSTADSVIEKILAAADECGIKDKIVGDVLVSPFEVKEIRGKQNT